MGNSRCCCCFQLGQLNDPLPFLEREVHSVNLRVFRERLSIFGCASFLFLVLGGGGGGGCGN